MTYRERREAKAERLREWADKREIKSAVAHAKVDAIADMIPMGQPILVGHHSEGRHRRDLDRIHNGMGQAIEHGRKADEFRRRADSIEAAAERSVYSDDLDAIERLEARITEREAERERIKTFNASCRQGTPKVDVLDDQQRATLESVARHAPYQLGKGGAFPTYALSNLSATINKDKKRLAALERGTA
jgi:hypothetical protein